MQGILGIILTVLSRGALVAAQGLEAHSHNFNLNGLYCCLLPGQKSQRLPILPFIALPSFALPLFFSSALFGVLVQLLRTFIERCYTVINLCYLAMLQFIRLPAMFWFYHSSDWQIEPKK